MPLPKEHKCTKGSESRVGPDLLSGYKEHEKGPSKKWDSRTRLCRCGYRARGTFLHPHQSSQIKLKKSQA